MPHPRTDPSRPAAPDVISVSRAAALGGVELVRARFVRRATPLHSHAEVEVGVVTSGRRRVRCGHRTYHARAGSIVVFRPWEFHAGAPVDRQGSGFRSFLLGEQSLADAAGWRGPGWFPAPVLHDPRLARALVDAHRRALAEIPARAEGPLLTALTDLARRHRVAGVGPPERDPEPVRRARAYLEAHYATRVRLATLAEVAGVSVFHLIRIFRAATGLPPYAFLAQVRVSRAAALLRAGHPVSRVAFLTGFADQSHLTRFFTRLVGVPPGRYQRGARAPAGP